MILHKIKSDIVAHLSYFLGAGNEAIIIDPRRDSQIYVDIAKGEGMEICYIFETHRNEDYVIGSEELAEMSGAEIYHGVWPVFDYGQTIYDGQEFELEKFSIKAIKTPGHTPGCTSYAVTDKETGEHPIAVFTGDALFVQEVGRIDLGGMDKRPIWAANLYNSIHEKLLPLGDNVIIYPAHGAGSVCGAHLAEREISTLGTERLQNPLLHMTKDQFIEYKVKEHQEYPPYFRRMEKYNKEGSPKYGCGPNPEPLTPEKLKEAIKNGAILVDTRPPPSFGAGHVKDSYNVNLSRLGMVGWVLPYDKPLVFILDEQQHLEEVIRGMSRIGYDNLAGYLSGTIVKWYLDANKVETLDLMTVYDLKEKIDSDEDWQVLDVRRVDEYASGHIKDSKNIYTGRVEKEHNQISKNKPVAVICSSGNRSSFASSMLLRKGFTNLHNVLGGMTAWDKAGFSTEK